MTGASRDDSRAGAVGVLADSEVVRLRRELERLSAEYVRSSRLLDLRGQDTAPLLEQLAAAASSGLVVMSSPVADKMALYADLFRARTDVYAVRWENTRIGASGWMPRRSSRMAKGNGRQCSRLPAADCGGGG